jgi:hypothetical protein
VRRQSLFFAIKHVQQVHELVPLDIQVRDSMPDKLTRRPTRPQQKSKPLKPWNLFTFAWISFDPVNGRSISRSLNRLSDDVLNEVVQSSARFDICNSQLRPRLCPHAELPLVMATDIGYQRLLPRQATM